jgi:hypothetical protein
MLYPIELLRHKSNATKGGAMDGVHVNGHACICHVVHRFFKCRQMPLPGADLFTVQIASLQKATIAKCNTELYQK